jgi:transposase
VRALLYEAASTVLRRVRRPSALRSWGLKIMKRAGFKRAAIAVARKLAVILHAIWRNGSAFDPMIVAA